MTTRLYIIYKAQSPYCIRQHEAVTNICQIGSGYYCFLNYTSIRTSAELLISVYCLNV